MPRSIYITFLLSIFLFFQGMESYAHPHIFVDTKLDVVIEKGKLNGFWVQYSFDPMFSSYLLLNYDVDENKSFSEAEISQLYSESFEHLQQYSYFITVLVNDKSVALNKAERFSVMVDDYGKVTYKFFTPLKKTVSGSDTECSVLLYDEEYYMDFSMRTSNVSFQGTDPEVYNSRVYSDKTIAFYFDQIHPRALSFQLP